MREAAPGNMLPSPPVAHFVVRLDCFDVVAATNLVGDILSDLGPATTGTIGLAPSANLNSERTFPSLFEPMHPISKAKTSPTPLPSGALMLDFLTQGQGAGRQAHDAIVAAIEEVIKTGPKTPDFFLGGARPTPRRSGKRLRRQLRNGNSMKVVSFCLRAQQRRLSKYRYEISYYQLTLHLPPPVHAEQWAILLQLFLPSSLCRPFSA
ncbi:hypothetical protein AVME950_22310 [Acidovorax sp. SUPP950]|nr:hypothetical protein AVME950_22310 [Acidovorax sp. SUPP950]